MTRWRLTGEAARGAQIKEHKVKLFGETVWCEDVKGTVEC